MDSLETISDKAHRLQDTQIKANHNFFLTWDQWVPPKLGPTPSLPKDHSPVSFKPTPRPKRPLPTCARNQNSNTSSKSSMPTSKDKADALVKQHFGKEVFDLCWTIESEPTSTTLGEPHYGGQTFEMCWTTQTDLVPVVKAPAKASMTNATAEASLAKPLYGGQEFAMCWDNEPHTAPTIDAPTDGSLAKLHNGSQAFNMCWDTDNTSTKGQYNICWDEPSSSKALLVPMIRAEAATPPRPAAASYDLCWGEEPP
ncbi:hypothetical protein BDR07DRAFT_1480798 [Suillus spraguei]|nr:hypothetical protein BDR07DRAFT_1480798 [Suillus spraguei]